MCTYQGWHHWNGGVRELGVYWVLGVYEEILWIWEVMGKAPPALDILTNIESLLTDTTTYKTITKDPTNKLKNKLFQAQGH